ncbi:MAG: nucleotidyltransferase domain-containing protein [Actinomycetota bacterium]|jgi:lincosamide nucleotidyltransferase|nr:nucleotidyltransferase domain-containing protein [Actinomycetota bacterium]
MIERTRQLCREDERLVAAMMYGSFAQGEGDGFSDIEFILFFEDDALENVDQQRWVSKISPVELYYVNEYGNGTAIFEGLIRGEFHFDRASDIGKIDESWRETGWFPSLDDALVLDRTGELARRLRAVVGLPLDRDTPERVRFARDSFINWLLFGSNLVARGEDARALDLLFFVQRYLLHMVRLLEGKTEHWPSPSKALESDISRAAYARYAACTARLNGEDIRSAYLSAWEWGKEMMEVLGGRHGLESPATLLERMDQRLAGTLGVSGSPASTREQETP